MSKVIVTGGAGFVGHHLVNKLLNHGHHVVVLDDMSRGSSVVDGAEYIEGDANSLEDCVRAFSGADMVFNLAATVAGVEYNMAHGYQMLLENSSLQVTPVAAAEIAEVPVFLQVSSACVYHPSVNQPAKEETIGSDPHAANFGYGWAKRLGERVALSSKIAKVVVVRPSNIYGSGDYFDDKAHVIPSLIKQYAGKTARLLGDGTASREFLYVTDAAEGMFHAALHGHDRGVYNLGTHGETRTSVAELHGIIANSLGSSAAVTNAPDYDNPEKHRWADCSKIRSLGWRHKVGIDVGISRTVEWYLEQR